MKSMKARKNDDIDAIDTFIKAMGAMDAFCRLFPAMLAMQCSVGRSGCTRRASKTAMWMPLRFVGDLFK